MSMKIFILCSIIAVGNCVTSDRSGRIIGGFDVSRGDLPYLVAITVDHPDGVTFCGGSLISPDFVLTAASCFKGKANVRAKVLGGVSDLFDLQGDERRSQEIFIHPGFDRDNLANDIALIKLQSGFLLGRFIQTVILPLRSDVGRSFNGFPAIAAGWGVTADIWQAPLPNQMLRAVRSSVITNIACRLRYPLYITENSICTSADSTIGTPCRGDEGGPLVVDSPGHFLQIGVFSFQFSVGCDRGWPAVFIRTSRYLDWIATVTGLNLP